MIDQAVNNLYNVKKMSIDKKYCNFYDLNKEWVIYCLFYHNLSKSLFHIHDIIASYEYFLKLHFSFAVDYLLGICQQNIHSSI